MPTLQLLSDIHLEFLDDSLKKKFFKDLDPSGVDILVLAGDVNSGSGLSRTLKQFCSLYPDVVYVMGNHELYGSSPREIHGEMFDICVENKNLHWLDNQMETVQGLTFAGGTLWFPEPVNLQTLRLGKSALMDYRMIQDFEPWVYEQNRLFEMFLDWAASRADVVVSHHLPSAEAISPRFRTGRDASLNHFFCRDLFFKIQEWKPPLWLFGHTHDRKQFQLEETLLLCNPLGYPHENEGKQLPERGPYRSKCLIRVEKDSPPVVLPNP